MSEFFDDYIEEPVEDDLSDIGEEDRLPDEGWYRAKVLSVSSRPTRKGDAMRTVTFSLNSTNGHECREYFARSARQRRRIR